jgi:hypothetical protein
MAPKNIKEKANKDRQRIIKTAVNVVLIAFIAVSIGYAAFKAAGGQKNTLGGPVAVIATPDREKAKVVLYYLHPTGRCARCIAMEKYTQETVEKYFQEQVKNGTLEFKSLNTDERQNRHFINDYKLVTKALVITLVKGGKEQKYDNLTGIWQNVGSQVSFYDYVRTNVEKYLKEAK